MIFSAAQGCDELERLDRAARLGDADALAHLARHALRSDQRTRLRAIVQWAIEQDVPLVVRIGATSYPWQTLRTNHVNWLIRGGHQQWQLLEPFTLSLGWSATQSLLVATDAFAHALDICIGTDALQLPPRANVPGLVRDLRAVLTGHLPASRAHGRRRRVLTLLQRATDARAPVVTGFLLHQLAQLFAAARLRGTQRNRAAAGFMAAFHSHHHMLMPALQAQQLTLNRWQADHAEYLRRCLLDRWILGPTWIAPVG